MRQVHTGALFRGRDDRNTGREYRRDAGRHRLAADIQGRLRNTERKPPDAAGWPRGKAPTKRQGQNGERAILPESHGPLPWAGAIQIRGHACAEEYTQAFFLYIFCDQNEYSITRIFIHNPWIFIRRPADPGRSLGKRPAFGASNSSENL